VPEETDQEVAGAETADEGIRSGRSSENIKPVYLKGLFSVSTTSSKPLPVIRADIIRVLKQLRVEYHEIKGGFSCKHAPSIDLNKGSEGGMGSPQAASGSMSQRRKISFGGLMGAEKEKEEFRNQQQTSPRTPKTPQSRQERPDLSFTNSDESDDAERREDRRPVHAGETSTHVREDVGTNMVLRFEILLVKVPLLSLHGIQFKKVDGNMMHYKNMAQEILKALRL